MRYIVLGAGAIGGLVGGLLSRAGQDVVLIARGDHRTAIQERGLRVEQPSDSFTCRAPCQAVDEVTLEADDHVLLCTKSQDSAAAIGALPIASQPVFCMQNGVANERLCADADLRVYGAMVFVPAVFLQPGVVQGFSHPSPGVIDVGRYPTGDDAVAGRVAADLRSAGFDSRTDTRVMRYKYSKLLTNLTGILQALGGPRAMERRDQVIDEAERVLDAAGIDYIKPAELMARCEAVENATISGKSRPGGSTWQSLRRNKPLETAYLNGEISALARTVSLPTPLNDGLLRMAERASIERIEPGQLEQNVAALFR